MMALPGIAIGNVIGSKYRKRSVGFGDACAIVDVGFFSLRHAAGFLHHAGRDRRIYNACRDWTVWLVAGWHIIDHVSRVPGLSRVARKMPNRSFHPPMMMI
jgi:hypothetical protein